MMPRIADSRRHAAMLALALSACVLQALGGALPSLVVCYKGSRPPRVELFSASCSCRLEAGPSCSGCDGHGAAGLGESCTDVHLPSHALLAACAQRHAAPARNPRLLPGREAPPASSFSIPAPMPGRGGPPLTASPPPRSLLLATSILLC